MRQSVTELDRAMMDVASSYVLCPRFEEPSVHEFQVGERKELWSRGGVVWIKVWSNRIKVRSNRIKMRSNRIKMLIKMRSKVEQRLLFYLIPNWSLALRQAHLNTGLRRYWKKDYTNKMKLWMDRAIN